MRDTRLTVLLTLGGITLSVLPGIAQEVLPDDSLGVESSRVRQVVNNDLVLDVIEGGQSRGPNLFHSFTSFGVGAGRAVYFENPAGIEQIFSRVTGNAASRIDGTLGVSGSADLFLLNPNGILFGPGARLDLAGSFIASTADAFDFGADGIFEVLNLGAAPLLTLKVQPGLQVGRSPIVAEGALSSEGGLLLNGSAIELQGALAARGGVLLRSPGSITLGDYTGGSLHILSGGSVTVGDVTVMGQGLAGNVLRESVLLSDGATVVEIDGAAEPTVDVRSGILALSSGDGTVGSGIEIGDIRNEGGTVLLTNQYQPNLTLQEGDIQAEMIDTRQIFEMGQFANGGDVWIDSQWEIELNGDLITAARVGNWIGDLSELEYALNPNIIFLPSGDIAEAKGGSIFLKSGSNILGQNLNTSAQSVSYGETLNVNDITRPLTLSHGGNIVIQADGEVLLKDIYTYSASISEGSSQFYTINGTAISQGNIEAVSNSSVAGNIGLSSSASARIGEIYASAYSYTKVNASVESGNSAQIGEIKTITAGGDISLDSLISLTAKNIQSSSNSLVNIDASAQKYANDNPVFDVVNGGTILAIDQTVFGGDITVYSNQSFESQKIDSSIRINTFIDLYASTFASKDSSFLTGNGGKVDAGKFVGNSGDINISAGNSFVASDILAFVDVAHLDFLATASSDSFAYAGRGGEINSLDLSFKGGNIDISSQNELLANKIKSYVSVDSRINFGSFDDSIQVQNDVSRVPINSYRGGEIGSVRLASTSGNISVHANTSAITGNIDSSVENLYVLSVIGSLRGGKIGSVESTERAGDVSIFSSSLTKTEDISSYINSDITLSASSDLLSYWSGKGGKIGEIQLSAAAGDIIIDSDSSVDIGNLSTYTSTLISSSAVSFLGQIQYPTSDELTGGSTDNIEVSSNGGDISVKSGDSIRIGNVRSFVEGLHETSASVNVEKRFGSFYTLEDFTGETGISGTIRETAQSGKISVSQYNGVLALRNIDFSSSVINMNGDSGEIQILSPSIELKNFTASTSIAGEGSSGGIYLSSEKTVSLDNSRLTTAIEPGANGKGGNIELEGESILLKGFTLVDTTNFGDEIAGNVVLLSKKDITILDSSIVTITGGLGDAGDVILLSEGTLDLFGNSVVSTASLPGSRGSGGNIIVQSLEGLVVDGRTALIFPSKQLSANAKIQERSGFNDDFKNAQDLDSAFGVDINDADNPEIELSNQVPYVSIEGYLDESDISGTEYLEFGDKDVYAFNVASAGVRLRWKTPLDSTSRFLFVDLIDENGQILNDQDDSNGSRFDFSLGEFIFEKPGRYALRIVSYDPGEYILNVQLTDSLPVSTGFSAQSQSSGNAGNIFIETPQISLLDGGQIATSATGSGKAGNITLSAFNSDILNINFQNNLSSIPDTSQFVSQITAETRSTGNGGNIILAAPTAINITGNGVLNAQTSATGSAGNVTVTTDRFTLDQGTRLTTTATATATPPANTLEPSANITLNANEMNLFGTVQVLSETQGEAQAGRLTLRSNTSDDLTINLREQSRVSASTSSSGKGGSLLITAPNSVSISGEGSLSAETSGSGLAGNLMVETQRFTLQNNAQLSTSTTGEGNGGNLRLIAPQSITLQNQAQVVARSSSAGKAGNLEIETGQLNLRQAEASVSSSGVGDGGNLEIDARAIALYDQSRLSASTASGEGGNLRFSVDETLLLRHGSKIATNAGGSGNGGNIDLTVPFLLGIPRENSDITANAVRGNGGNINITGQSIIGLKFRPQLTLLSDITASSEFGAQGNIALDIIDADPSQGLSELPSSLVDPTALIDRRCELVANPTRSSRFVQRGRWGIPSSPERSAQDAPFQADLGPDLQIESVALAQPTPTIQESVSLLPIPILEAQDWSRDARGNIQLLAARPVYPNHSPQVCSGDRTQIQETKS